MVTTKNIAPFGSAQQRFGRISVHPGLDKYGVYSVRSRGCDPCLYNPQSINKTFEVNKNGVSNKDPWRYKIELEEWAQNLGYRNQAIIDYKAYRSSVLGPAWHEVNVFPKYQAACKNLSFGRTSRTRPSLNKTPGPGTYYKAQPFKAPYGPHSSRPTFDREEPCRFKDTAPKWSLAPGRYTIIDKDCIEQKSKKVISLRGPYDLFTGVRDDSTIKNHFNKSLRVSAATWPIALKGSLHKYDKSHFGKMNKTGRELPHRGRGALVDIAMCVKRPEEPGPGHYPIGVGSIALKTNKRPFNSSYDKGLGYVRVMVWPAVGRYSPSDVRCGLPGQGHRHVFLSKEGRTIGSIIPKPMNSF